MHEYNINRLIEGLLHLNATLEACFAKVDGFEEVKECLGMCEWSFLSRLSGRKEEGGLWDDV